MTDLLAAEGADSAHEGTAITASLAQPGSARTVCSQNIADVVLRVGANGKATGYARNLIAVPIVAWVWPRMSASMRWSSRPA